MRDHNDVSEVGRLTRNAEIKYTNSSLAICQFSIAVNRSKKVGEKYEDEPNFFNVVIFGQYAQSMQSHLTQGKQILVKGELRQQRWVDDNGKNRSAIVIVGEFIQFLRSPGDHTQNGQYPQGQQNRQSQGNPQRQPPGNRNQAPSNQPPNPGYGYSDFEDDIPF